MIANTSRLASGLLTLGLAGTVVADGVCRSAADLAFIRPEFIRWHIDSRDPGGCSTPDDFEGFWQWGLPTDQFLAGEPLNSLRDGYAEMMVYRPDYGDPALGRWWVLWNDQHPGYSGTWSEHLFGLAGDRAVIINRDGFSGDRAAVKQGDFFIIDSNGNMAYDGQPTDQLYTWPVSIGASDHLFAADVVGNNFEDLIVWRNATGRWEFYLFYLTPNATPSVSFSFGVAGDLPAIGDVNADGHEDLMFFRPSNRRVYVDLWESGDPHGGYAGLTDCIRSYNDLISDAGGGTWNAGFVALNFDGLDDSDGDGVPDCEDGCPDDPNKIAPGECGCGVPDTDTDGDGVPDCIDECPLDPDTDGDGFDDCVDECYLDPDKREPGVCGCGTPDVDSDGDGYEDCIEDCDFDPDKQDPGLCGCGIPDTDSDGDGVPDCDDECPFDPLDNCECPADVTQDGEVDFVDLLELLFSWGPCGLCLADVDRDGTVGFTDLLLVLAAQGPCPES